MPERSIRRGPTAVGYATPTAAPVYVDSDDNKLKFIPAGSGTTEVEIVDASTAQTLTNKTLTAPVITGASVVPVAEVVTTTNVIAASESGSVFFLDLAGGFVSTLPAVALGLEFTFIVKTAPTGSYTIVPASGNLFKGHVLTTDVNSATDGDFDTTAVGTLTFVLNKAVAGDRIHVICDGTNWFYSAECSVFDGITGT